MILAIDLDGTLLKTDMLYESFLLLIKKNPLYLFLLPIWLLKGKAFVKRQIAHRIQISPETLPYNQELLAWLKQQKADLKDLTLLLVTGTDQLIAEKIASHLNLFDQVHGSDGFINLTHKKKQQFLDLHYGEKNYGYVGNSNADLPIWEHSHSIGMVNAKDRLKTKVKGLNTSFLIDLARPKFSVKVWLQALRIHQYAKNILIFLPLVLAHDFLNLPGLLQLVLGFICFSLLASSVYIFNDLLDLTADRKHPRKCQRPFASGKLSIPNGIMVGILCLVLAISMTSTLPAAFGLVLGIYYLLTCAYSFSLKSLALVDVYTLAILYTLRIFAGITILNSGYSSWFILFSFFIFTSLAFVKRFTELLDASTQEKQQLHGRGYHTENLLLVKMFGVSSGFLSVLVFGLYLSSFKASSLYHSPQMLYALCPILLYWISRIWLKASEGKVHEDPVLFALKDKVTYGLGILVLIIGIMATL